MKRRDFIGFVGLILTAAGLAAYIAWTPVLIWYHRRALDRLQTEIYSTPTEQLPNGITGYGSGELFAREDQHKHRLAELGYYFFKRYEMEKVPDSREAHRTLFKLMQQQFPGTRYSTLAYLGNEIEVYDLAAEEPKWDAFAEKYNVPDLAERYASEANQPPSQQPDLKGKTPPKTIEEYRAEWPNMGMWLPDDVQVSVFRDNFYTARSLLGESLSDPDKSIRICAAYVTGKIGPSARPMGEELLARLVVEPEVTVRISIIDALNAIGYDTKETVQVLKDRYQSLDGTNVPRNRKTIYSQVDEKIKVASALYVFVDADSQSEYFDFVTQWLDPPAKDLTADLLRGYWERRWIAVNSLEHMPTAKEAIPKLESLKMEPDAKPWVHVHVPRVLDLLRKSSQQ